MLGQEFSRKCTFKKHKNIDILPDRDVCYQYDQFAFQPKIRNQVWLTIKLVSRQFLVITTFKFCQIWSRVHAKRTLSCVVSLTDTNENTFHIPFVMHCETNPYQRLQNFVADFAKRCAWQLSNTMSRVTLAQIWIENLSVTNLWTVLLGDMSTEQKLILFWSLSALRQTCDIS